LRTKPTIPATKAGGPKVIGFGDFPKYVIRDVMAARLFRFEDSAFMKNGQVGFLSWSRHDGDRIDVNFDAIKCLTKA
jgi:HK97 family phage major capsid protein